jgi:cytochrome c biogenesis protein CcdA
MEEFLQNLMSNSSLPIVTAFILGLMTAISPCPLATNITAIGFISKDIDDKRRVFLNGLIYTLGRAVAYTLLAVIIFIGADQFEVSGWFQKYGEKIIGPVLIIIGLLMLDVLKIKFPGLNKLTQWFENKSKHNYWDVLLLGVLFALTVECYILAC